MLSLDQLPQRRPGPLKDSTLRLDPQMRRRTASCEVAIYSFEVSRVGLVVWLSGSARTHTLDPWFSHETKANRFCVYVTRPYFYVKTDLIRKVLCVATLGR